MSPGQFSGNRVVFLLFACCNFYFFRKHVRNIRERLLTDHPMIMGFFVRSAASRFDNLLRVTLMI